MEYTSQFQNILNKIIKTKNTLYQCEVLITNILRTNSYSNKSNQSIINFFQNSSHLINNISQTSSNLLTLITSSFQQQQHTSSQLYKPTKPTVSVAYNQKPSKPTINIASSSFNNPPPSNINDINLYPSINHMDDIINDDNSVDMAAVPLPQTEDETDCIPIKSDIIHPTIDNINNITTYTIFNYAITHLLIMNNIFIVSTSTKGALTIIDIYNNRIKTEIQNKLTINGLCKINEQLFLYWDNKTIYIHKVLINTNTNSNKPLQQISTNDRLITTLCSINNINFAVAYNDTSLEMFTIDANGEYLNAFHIKLNTCNIISIIEMINNKVLITGNSDDKIQRIKIENKEFIKGLSKNFISVVGQRSLCKLNDNEFAVCARSHNKENYYLKFNVLVCSFPELEIVRNVEMNGMDLELDCDYLYFVKCSECSVYIVDLIGNIKYIEDINEECPEVTTLSHGVRKVKVVQYVNDRKLFVVATNKGKVMLCNSLVNLKI